MSAQEDVAGSIVVAVGARIRIRRRLLGMSQAELAWVLDVAPGRVDQIERGARRPSAATLAKTAETLGTTVDSLLGEDPDEVLPSALATQGGGFW